MFYTSINSSRCLCETSTKMLPGGWTSQIKNNIFPEYMTTSSSLMLTISFFLIFSTILVISGLIRWITVYKLQYLFRISFTLFIYSLISLYIPFDVYIISFFIPNFQESTVFSIFCQKNSTSNFFGTFCFLMGIVRYHWALPVNIIKDNRSVGFNHLEGTARSRRRTVRDLSDKMLKHREPGELNPVYVNGWIPLIESREVVKEKVMSVIAIGHKFCVYRGESGHVFVLDAYCPHLGADLSAGGKVIGNCIECPFHGWQFSGQTGKCTKIPYAKKIPDVAKMKVWESCEKNGYVFAWHHAENEPPTWELPSVPEVENGEWVYRGRSEFTVHCHIQEIPENGADIAHLSQVHSRFVMFGSSVENTRADEWIKHCWQPQWSADEKESHIARVKIIMRLTVGAYEVPYSRIDVDIQQIGPTTVYLYMDTKFGRGIFLQYIITEGPMLQRVVQELYTEPKFKPAPASFLIWGEAIMIERDIAVWNNKKFLKNPLLVAEDKLIRQFRRWYSQFYSKHSPTLKDIKQRTLDW